MVSRLNFRIVWSILISLSLLPALAALLAGSAGAMHIMEGYLPVGHCIRVR